MFAALRQLKVVVAGDIGCYSLGVFPPLKRIDTILCMGAGISMAHGMTKAGEPRVIADLPAAVTWDGQRLPGPWLTVRALELAVKGMLPRNPLGRAMARKLRPRTPPCHRRRHRSASHSGCSSRTTSGGAIPIRKPLLPPFR